MLSGSAAVIGVGNVALDVARILAKSRAEFAGSDIAGHALDRLAATRRTGIAICGRRGPHAIAMTPKELGELAHLEGAQPVVDPADLPPVEADEALDPGQRKSVALLRAFAEAPVDPAKVPITFRFWRAPLRVERAELVLAVTAPDAEGRPVPTGAEERVAADLIVSAIGYRTPPIHGRAL